MGHKTWPWSTVSAPSHFKLVLRRERLPGPVQVTGQPQPAAWSIQGVVVVVVVVKRWVGHRQTVKGYVCLSCTLVCLGGVPARLSVPLTSTRFAYVCVTVQLSPCACVCSVVMEVQVAVVTTPGTCVDTSADTGADATPAPERALVSPGQLQLQGAGPSVRRGGAKVGVAPAEVDAM